MATENQYSPEVLELTGGLDFISAKPSAGRGTLSDCLNFEIGARKGYSRIGGYERFDGGTYNPSLNYTNLALFQFTGSSGPFTEGELLAIKDPEVKLATRVIGAFKEIVLLSVGGDTVQAYWVVLITDYSAYLSLVGGSSIVEGATSKQTATFDSGQPYVLSNARVQSLIFNSDYFYPDNISREAPNSIGTGGNNPLTGLHYYKDDLYAITDYLVYSFTTGAAEIFSGDVLTSTVGGHTARVVDSRVSTGTWAGGNAAGYLLLKKLTGDASGAQTVDRLGVPTAALTLTGVSSQESWSAGLFKTSSSGGWSEVNTGYEFTFSGGTSNGPPATYSRGSAQSVVVPVSASSAPTAATATGTWTTNGAGSVVACINANDAAFMSLSSSASTPSAIIQATTFPTAIAIPGDSAITGISMKLRCSVDTIAKFPNFLVQCIDSTGVVGNVKATPIVTTSDTEYVLGGPTDLWGIADVRASLASGFGLNIAARQYTSPPGTTVFKVNYVELTIYYTDSVSSYYFYNGVDDVVAPITNYYVDSGDWTTNDAHGFMQIASITPHGSATRTYIQAGDQIRTAPAGAGGLVALVESNAVYAGLEPFQKLLNNNSRYQMITANFYGNEDWEAIYGVSGAGQAFVYDGFYFRRIFTGKPPGEDKPRHIAFNQLSLVLGYAAGHITVSVYGNPENFSGILGASDHNVGDPVTGLLRMNGTTLGIFCQSSITGLTGTNIDNYALNVLSPKEGALEYSVQDMGKPVYCSNEGVGYFDQTAAYGNFLGSRWSHLVSSWLIPRLQNRAIPTSFAGQSTPAKGATGFLFSTVCRAKNQYRMYFADGVCLTMTLYGAEQQPMFSLQQYDKWTTPATITNGVAYTKFLPLGYTNALDNLGRERIFMSHYDGLRDSDNGETTYYAYEFEASWSFDGFPIPCSMEVNENFFGTPFDYDTLAKVRIHGVSQGYAPLSMQVYNTYKDPAQATPTIYPIHLPRTPLSTITYNPEPHTNIASPRKTGRSFSIRMFYDRTNTLEVYPPFAVQVLQIQHKEGRGDI